MKPAIEVRELQKAYGGIRAVDHVSFDVEAGSVSGLLGANGAGKTTTLAILLGLLTPTSGQVRVLGDDMLTNRYRVLPRVNFSSPYVDLPQRLTVRENLEIYARLYGVRDRAQRIGSLCRELDIEAFRDRPYGTLSAGQKTRITLAKALINQPELLLLDEPTASLDPDTADRVRSWLLRYRAETGATILLASHNMAEVERICDHVMIMRAGRIVASGSPATLVADHDRGSLEEVFLDVVRDQADSETPMDRI